MQGQSEGDQSVSAFFYTTHSAATANGSLLSLSLLLSVFPSFPSHHPVCQCASKVNGGGFSSSKEFPDEVLRFVRSHPVMYRAVLPQHRRPILLQTEPGRRKLTQIAVDRVQAQDGHYHVLYIGTGIHTVNNSVLCFIQNAMHESLYNVHITIVQKNTFVEITVIV